MTVDEQARVLRRVLRKTPQTAGELAERTGFQSGRSISKALGDLVRTGQAVVIDGRQLKYTRP